MCFSDAYLILDLGGQYVDIVNNNANYISSVAMYVGMVDMHKFLPCPRHTLFDKYDAHVASQSFNMSQIYDCPFQQIFYFVHCGFGI